LKIRIQNVVASATFNQTFDLKAIAKAFPRDTEFKGRFPGLVFRLKKPKTTMLIFRTGKMVCTGGKGEDEARRAIMRAIRELKNGGINVARKPEIQITNILFEPEQFPALIYRWESPKVIFLVFSTGKIVCVGARKEKDIYEAIEKLQRKLEQSEVLIKS